MNFLEAEIGSYQKRIGDDELAKQLILTTNMSNKEIAEQSGINKNRVPQLRMKLRKQ